MKYKTDPLAQHQIDRLLRWQAKICTNLGIDSTKEEKKEAIKKIAILDRLIRKIDRSFFPSLESTK
jgi:hypothetical protein